MRGPDQPPAGCDRLANRAAQTSGLRRRPVMAWSSGNTRHDDHPGGLAKRQLRRDGGCARGSRPALDALPGARPEGKGDLAPRVETRRRARQMQDEAADGADDVDAELE